MIYCVQDHISVGRMIAEISTLENASTHTIVCDYSVHCGYNGAITKCMQWFRSFVYNVT